MGGAVHLPWQQGMGNRKALATIGRIVQQTMLLKQAKYKPVQSEDMIFAFVVLSPPELRSSTSSGVFQELTSFLQPLL